MTTAALGTTDTRTRLIEAAIDLFTRHSFAGTSLQMIADELGFTKAAIYHHFRTREQLLAAVIEPMLDELRAVVESAETKRTPHARAEHMLSGYAALAVRNRGLVAVLATDPSVATVLTDRAEWGKLILRQLALLADVDPGPAGEFKAALESTGVPLHDAGDLETAFAAARAAARPGDVVLLSPACASYDQYRSFEQRGDHFRTLVADLRGG